MLIYGQLSKPLTRRKKREEKSAMNITGKTRLLGLIGTPVDHSKSPAMYNYCFEKYGMDCAYLAFDVPLEKAADAVNAIRTFNMRGANVTMPLKGAVAQYLDELSPASKAIGVVNTIVNYDGKLVGYTTDGLGYTGDLRRNGIEVAGKKITLLGGGSAGCALAIQAALDGARELAVFNRRDSFWVTAEENLKSIQAAAPECQIGLYDLEDAETLRREIAESDILTNATCVGMVPMDDMSPITDLTMLRPDLIVTDIIYNPVETKLLKDAKACGCRTFNALGLLIGQGAAAFELYSGGLEMPWDEVYAEFYK